MKKNLFKVPKFHYTLKQSMWHFRSEPKIKMKSFLLLYFNAEINLFEIRIKFVKTWYCELASFAPLQCDIYHKTKLELPAQCGLYSMQQGTPLGTQAHGSERILYVT